MLLLLFIVVIYFATAQLRACIGIGIVFSSFRHRTNAKKQLLSSFPERSTASADACRRFLLCSYNDTQIE